MTGTPSGTGGIGRRKLGVLLVPLIWLGAIAALVVPPATDAARGAPSDAGGESTGAGLAVPEGSSPCDPPDLAIGAARLERLASYRTLVESRRGRTFERYESVVVNRPVDARSVRLEASHGSIRFVMIGDRAWRSEPGGSFRPLEPRAAIVASSGADVALVIAPYASNRVRRVLRLIGVESRNGTSARRYEARAETLAEPFPASAGDSRLTVWLTPDCRLVALESLGVESPDVELRVDVTHVDDPANAVAPPT